MNVSLLGMAVLSIVGWFYSRRMNADFIKRISALCEDASIRTYPQAMLALDYIKARLTTWDKQDAVRLPRISQTAIDRACEDASYDWFLDYGRELVISMDEFLPGRHHALCIKRAETTHVISGLMEPAVNFLIDSAIRMDFNQFCPVPGVMERYGYAHVEYRSCDTSVPFRAGIWTGYLKHGGIMQVDAHEVLAELQECIREAVNRVGVRTASSGAHRLMLQQVSHDIRSPLNNVRTVLNVIRGARTSDDSESLIDVAQRNIDLMGEIVDTVLEYSSQSAGCLRPSIESFSLGTLVQDVAASFTISARLKKLTITSEVSSEIIVKADQTHLKRVLNNLVSNALKYTQSGGVHIRAIDNDQDVVMEISDTGIGMTSSELEKLFTPFSRFQRSMADGAGLGLVVAKQLLEAGGGSISVSSTYGKGSLFRVKLLKDQVAPRSASEGSASKARSILIIDDNEDWLASSTRTLSARGYHVSIARNAAEGKSMLRMENYYALLCDIEMEGGGAELLLAYLKGVASPPRILVISGRDVRRVTARFPGLPVMMKPVDFERVFDWLSVSTESSLREVA